LLVIYTKLQAVIAGILVAAIGQSLLKPAGLTSQVAVLAGFLGSMILVLLNTALQGYWACRYRKLEGWIMLEISNPIPHHISSLFSNLSPDPCS